MACQGQLYGTPLTLQASYEQQRGQCRRPQTTLPKAIYLVYNIGCELYMCAKSYATKLHQLLKVWFDPALIPIKVKVRFSQNFKSKKLANNFQDQLSYFEGQRAEGASRTSKRAYYVVL